MIMRRMVLSAPSLWWPRLAAFVLAALVAASAAVWGLRVAAPVQASSIAAVAAPALAPDAVAVARALGAATLADAPAAAPMLESARFALVGVLAQAHAQGAALLSVDGKPAKPFVVGANVADGWTLQTVQGRRATLARNGAEMVLELPALVPATTAPPAVAAAQPAPGKAAEPGPAIALKGKMAP